MGGLSIPRTSLNPLHGAMASLFLSARGKYNLWPVVALRVMSRVPANTKSRLTCPPGRFTATCLAKLSFFRHNIEVLNLFIILRPQHRDVRTGLHFKYDICP